MGKAVVVFSNTTENLENDPGVCLVFTDPNIP
jgi:hypothetical protein